MKQSLENTIPVVVDFWSILAAKKPARRLEYASTNSFMIIGGNGLSRVLNMLDQALRLDFAMRFHFKIANVTQLLEVLSALEEKECLLFLFATRDKIASSTQFFKVMRFLPESLRWDFLRMHHPLLLKFSDRELNRTSKYLAPSHLLSFGRLYHEQLISRYTIDFLVRLPPLLRYEFALLYQEKIGAKLNPLLEVLGQLSDTDQLRFIKTFEESIQDALAVSQVARILKPDLRFIFILGCLDCIRTVRELELVMLTLPEAQRLNLILAANDYPGLIQSYRDLRILLPHLSLEHQLIGFKYFFDKILCAYQLAYVLRGIADELRLSCAFHARKLITDLNGLERVFVLLDLSDEDALDFARKCSLLVFVAYCKKHQLFSFANSYSLFKPQVEEEKTSRVQFSC